jgi:hypothetical protein
MTKQFSNYSDLITFTRASKGHALRPVSYGDELVTNGTFDTDLSNWNNGSSKWTVSGSRAYHAPNSVFAVMRQSVPLTVGKIYRITFDYEVLQGQLRCQARDSSNQPNSNTLEIQDLTGTGSASVIFVPDSDYDSIGFARDDPGVTGEIYVDNVSVKEVLFDQPDGTLTLFEHPENVPRVEYDADGNRLGLLVEEARTNLILNSEDANSWVKSSVSVLQNTTTAPNKTLTADTVTRIASVADIRKTIAVTASNDYTITIFAKADTDAQIQLDVSNGAFSGQDYAQFNINTGAFVSGGTGATYSVVDVGDGWRRYSLTATCTNTQNTGVILRLANDEPVYLWGFQFEQGSFPTSYIKNEGTSSGVTRSADVVSIPVADFGYNQSAGTVVQEFSTADVFTANENAFSDGTNDNRIMWGLNANTGRAPYISAGGTNTVALINNSGIAGGVPSKLGIAFASNDVASSLDGGAVATDTSATIPTSITTLYLGVGATGTGTQINGHIKKLMYIPRRVTNAQLISLTE